MKTGDFFLPSKATASPSQNILDILPDDCLSTIFEQLVALDLCVAANVCIRFNDVATQLFKTRYQQEYFDVRVIIFGPQMRNVKLSQIDDYLKTFGSMIEKARVNDTTRLLHANDVLQMVAKHCAKLTELHIDSFEFDPNVLCGMQSAINKLKLLEIHYNSIPDELFDSSCQIERLKLCLYGDEDCAGPLIQLPKLKELNLRNFRLNGDCVARIWAGHNQLCHLKFNVCDISNDAWNLIPIYLPNIHELTLENCVYGQKGANFRRWAQQMKALKKLTMEGDKFPTVQTMQALAKGKIPIEELNLHVMKKTAKLIDAACGLKNIKSLQCTEMTPGINDEQLIRLIGSLKQLQMLVIASNDITLNGVKAIFRRSITLRILILKLTGSIVMNEVKYKQIDELIGKHNGIFVHILMNKRGMQVGRIECFFRICKVFIDYFYMISEISF